MYETTWFNLLLKFNLCIVYTCNYIYTYLLYYLRHFFKELLLKSMNYARGQKFGSVPNSIIQSEGSWSSNVLPSLSEMLDDTAL